jgi:hypothetical protein
MIVMPIELKEANAFVLSYHRHNKPVAGHRFSIGASDGEKLIGVAIIGRPVARHLQDGFTAEVLRCCVLPDAPKGTCSFLYSRAWKAWAAMGGTKMITYTLDNEPGSSLRGVGWKIVNQAPPVKGKGWTNRPGREWQAVHGQGRLRWEVAANLQGGTVANLAETSRSP